MRPYLSEKTRGEIPRVLKWLQNAGLAFRVFCSVGGLYPLCLSLQDKDYSHITAALTICALCAYGADKFIGLEMLNWLRGPRPMNGQGALLQAGWPAHSAAVQRQQGCSRHHGSGLLQHRPPTGLEPAAI